jgi:hypothetical protein
MPTWYVTYRRGRHMAMQVTEGREAAIDAACALLSRGMDVTEVTPAAGPRAARLDAMAIREIYQFQESAGRSANTMMERSNKGRTPGAGTSGPVTNPISAAR